MKRPWLASLSPDEVAGLRLFTGRGNCTQCHNGPLFTNKGFHSIGVPDPAGQPPDVGRFAGVQLALRNEFNCLGPYSDAPPEACEELTLCQDDESGIDGRLQSAVLAQCGPNAALHACWPIRDACPRCWITTTRRRRAWARLATLICCRWVLPPSS